MITIDFNSRGKMGLTEFIYSSIKQQILDGTLAAGEKLPSKRALAEHLKVSVITTQNAYAQLISEGYIYSVEKKGFFVTDISVEGSAQHPLHAALRPQEEAFQAAPSLLQQQDIFCDLASNSTADEKFPFTLWAHTLRQVLNSGDKKLLEKQSVNGVLELRKAIALYLRSFRGMEVSPEQIVVGAGTESLYSMLVQFLGRERTFAVENPGYHKVASIIELSGAKCIPLELDGQGISMEQLQKSEATVVHVSPNHHFPTGTVMPVRRRRELLAWAQNSSRIIIEDEYDSEFRFTGKPIPTLQSQDQSGSVIYINTFSKTLSPSFRISYMVLPKTLVGQFQKKLGFFTCPVSAFEQYTLARFIQEGNYEKHIIRMKNYYRNLRNELTSEIQKSALKSHATIREQEAGLHFILHIENCAGEKLIKDRLLDKGIKVLSLRDFFYGDRGDNPQVKGDNPQVSGDNPLINGDSPLASGDTPQVDLVINYSGISKQSIPELVRRMEKAII